MAVKTTPTVEASVAPHVKYVGTSDIRRISKQDWKAAKVDDHETLEWNAENEFTVPLENISPAALEILKKDSGFKVVEA